MESVESDGYKTDRAPTGNCHEDVTFIACTARSDSVFLVRLPVWMEAQEDVITRGTLRDGGEHRRPRTKRELDDGLQVAVAELTISIARSATTIKVAACGEQSPGSAFSTRAEWIGLDEALELVALIAQKDPRRYASADSWDTHSVSTGRVRWSWFMAGLLVGIVLFVVLVWLLFLGFGFNA